MKQIFKTLDKYFWLFFLLWLISYLVIILLYIPREMVGDEGNYLRLAENLTKGFYSPPPPGVHLWYGIGYPLFLSPWVALGFPIPLIRLINAPMLYGAVLLVYQGVKALTKNAQTALIAAAAFASYPPFYLFLPKIMTEIFAVLLISGFCFFYSSNQPKNELDRSRFSSNPPGVDHAHKTDLGVCNHGRNWSPGGILFAKERPAGNPLRRCACHSPVVKLTLFILYPFLDGKVVLLEFSGGDVSLYDEHSLPG